jgi:hypothetical protein
MRIGRDGWLVAYVVVAAAARALAGDPSAREWYQDAANGSRTSAVDVEPIRNDPVEAWRKRLDEGVICEPVTWSGTVFVMSRDAQGRQVLTALDPKTGAVTARTVRLSHVGDRVELVAWEGMVAAVEPTGVEAFAFKGTAFRSAWKRDGISMAFPCVHRGRLFVADTMKPDPAAPRDQRVERVFAMSDGKELGTSPSPIGGAVCVTDATRDGVDAQIVGEAVGQVPRYIGSWLLVQQGGLHRPARSGQPMYFTPDAPDLAGVSGDGLAVLKSASAQQPWYGVVRVASPSPATCGAWLFVSGVDLATRAGTACQLFVQPDTKPGGLLPTTIRPAVHAGSAYTFNVKGDLLAIGTEGQFETVLEAGKLPKGAVAGVPSIARNVICFGNWAADLDSRRVLWIRPGESPQETLVTPSVPIGDGLLLLRTSRGELRCLADPKAPAQTPPAAGAPAPAAAPRAPAALPKSMDGVLLRDGRQIAGSVLRNDDGSVLVTPQGEAGVLVAAADVVVAEEDGVVVAHAPESEVERVWRDGLRAAYVRRLETLFPEALTLEMPEKAAEILERARRWGMTDARVAELTRMVTGKRDAVNLDLRLKGFAKREGPVVDATYAEILQGAAWCGARKFNAAGAALLLLAIELDPARPDAVKAAAPLVPPEFPEHGASAAAAWLQWAPYLLAADGQFLADIDLAWQRTRRAPWDEGTIGIRTRNLLFFSRTNDPSVVGPCLAHGEQAVRALHTLLGVHETASFGTDDDRLEVRLHRNREDYLAEAGKVYMEWTLGYFSPVENVSRFYVPEKDDSPLPLGRGLFKTMAHELTHHYVEMRWAPKHGGSSPNAAAVPGYWVVEGLARFVEDQVVDSETRGLTFADATVPSVDAAAQLARAGKLLPTDWFCDADHRAFFELSPEPAIDVRLARSLLSFRLSEAAAFYEQAGSLVFFLWNQRGAEGRDAFVEYLQAHYNGVLARKSWRKLGFESSAALDKAYRDWLATLGR